MNYSLNISKQIKRALGPLLAKPKRIAWLEALLFPMQALHDNFIVIIAQYRYQLTITGQVNRLEKALQDRYGKPQIYIETNYNIQEAIYTKEEEQNQYFYITTKEENIDSFPIYTKDETTSGADFIVYVPEDIMIQEQDIRAFVNIYRVAGTRFIVKAI